MAIQERSGRVHDLRLRGFRFTPRKIRADITEKLLTET